MSFLILPPPFVRRVNRSTDLSGKLTGIRRRSSTVQPLEWRAVRAPRPTAVEEPASNYRGWIAVVLGVAVAARLVRWGLGFPLWGDEILIALNLLDMEGFGDVVKPLRLPPTDSTWSLISSSLTPL